MPWSPSRDGTQWSPVAISVCSLSSCIVKPVRVPARERLHLCLAGEGCISGWGRVGGYQLLPKPPQVNMLSTLKQLACHANVASRQPPSNWKCPQPFWVEIPELPVVLQGSFSPLCPLAPQWDSFLRPVSHFAVGREDWPPANTVTTVKFHFSKHFPSPCSDLGTQLSLTGT